MNMTYNETIAAIIAEIEPILRDDINAETYAVGMIEESEDAQTHFEVRGLHACGNPHTFTGSYDENSLFNLPFPPPASHWLGRHLHGVRLDTVKSWSSGRNPVPARHMGRTAQYRLGSWTAPEAMIPGVGSAKSTCHRGIDAGGADDVS